MNRVGKGILIVVTLIICSLGIGILLRSFVHKEDSPKTNSEENQSSAASFVSDLTNTEEYEE